VGGVPHWGIDLVDPDEEFTVAQFKTYAEERIADMLSRGKLPIVVGGTGLWVRALIENLTLTDTPPNPALRAELDARSLDDLFAEYKRLDPEGAEVIDRDNKRRVLRALEVTRTSGKPFSQLLAKGAPKYDVLEIGVEMPREQLYERINDRVEVMIARGLVDEVRGLRTRYPADAIAMTGIGYRQVCAFLDGKTSLAAAIEQIKQDTRNYAKRQLTWFKKDARVRWVESAAQAVQFVGLFKNAS
jgi:tRNA dimethylallyltransferase